MQRCRIQPTATVTTPDTTSKRKRQPAPVPLQIHPQWLYDREQTKAVTRMSLSSQVRAEKAGRLRPIRPTGSPSGKVHYSGANLLEIIGAGREAR